MYNFTFPIQLWQIFDNYSDGVGRTGTFICIHAQLERLKTEGVVDFFQFIKSVCMHRAGLVSNAVSFGVLYIIIAVCIMILLSVNVCYIHTYDNRHSTASAMRWLLTIWTALTLMQILKK